MELGRTCVQVDIGLPVQPKYVHILVGRSLCSYTWLFLLGAN